MTDAWMRIGEAFVRAVDRLNEVVCPDDRGFVSRVQQTSNDTFALRALVSYSPRSAPGDEHLVVSLDFRREGQNVVGQADLARGDGFVLDESEILAASPERRFAMSVADVETVEKAVEEFVGRQLEVLRSELQGSS